MPRDVATRWNSTFDMLHFAIEYRPALDKITAKWENNLRSFELSGEEWKIASDLHDALEVSVNACLHDT